MDGKRVLIIVQNLSVPFDRRVWLEACSLRDSGFQVSVVCPMGTGDKAREVLDGILIRRYPPPPETRGLASYLYEFVYCWLRTARLVLRAHRAEGFDVIQACNPPDTFWALALPFKLVGRRFVFDQHDLCPEVYESRFPDGSRALLGGLRLLERATYAVADHVISTNESYRATAMRRGNVASEDITVVRTGPDPDRLRRGESSPDWRRGRTYLCAYLGVMGPQDGVDLALRAVAEFARDGRDDTQFVFMGKGDSTDELMELAKELEIDGPRHLHRQDSRRGRLRGTLDGRSRAVPRPAQPPERRLDHEQDDGVHGVRASRRRVRPEGDARLGRRRRHIRPAE